MRIICIIGAIITTILVGQDVLIENYDLWFETDEYYAIVSSFNTLLVVLYFGIFAFYLYKRSYFMVLVLWCIMCIIYIWQFYKLQAFNWDAYPYDQAWDEFIFLYNVAAAAAGIVALGILVSAAKKRIALLIFAIVSILVVLVATKEWGIYGGYWYVRMVAITSPLLIALNYILELKNYKAHSLIPSRKRVEILDHDETT